MLQIHADGIERAVRNEAGRPAREKAFTLMTEMFLMPHSCHWFCRNKTIASVCMRAQHTTHSQQALDTVSPETRQAYLVGPDLFNFRRAPIAKRVG